MPATPLRVGLGGLGAVGLPVARALLAGIDGLELEAIAVRDIGKARAALPTFAEDRFVSIAELGQRADIVIEGLPPPLFRAIAESAIDAGRIFMPASVGQILVHDDLVQRARSAGARIIVPTGALLGLDAVRAAAEGTIHSVRMITRKPPNGLEGAPYLVQHGITLVGLNEARKVFDGSARDGAKGFPANVNVAAALSLAGIGPDRTRLEIWADPAVDRNMHRIELEADSARFTLAIENVPSETNPRTGMITGLSVIAALRGLVSTLKVGT